MAHKKAGGSTSNGRDSRAKRLGVKRFGRQRVNAGEVIIRQKGTKFRVGENTYVGKDYTLHAAIDGVVAFSKKRAQTFDGARKWVTLVHVEAAKGA